ncbi:MAG: AHH domain-containing protein [Myxococcaceae bacterium]|nr:AHH domain-containing protein [Myxococcaceae bacterium]
MLGRYGQAARLRDPPPENKVNLFGHFGPHPEEYHKEVFRRLQEAVEDCRTQQACREKLRKELKKIADEVCTPGTKLHRLITKSQR